MIENRHTRNVCVCNVHGNHEKSERNIVNSLKSRPQERDENIAIYNETEKTK